MNNMVIISLNEHLIKQKNVLLTDMIITLSVDFDCAVVINGKNYKSKIAFIKQFRFFNFGDRQEKSNIFLVKTTGTSSQNCFLWLFKTNFLYSFIHFHFLRENAGFMYSMSNHIQIQSHCLNDSFLTLHGTHCRYISMSI